MKVLVVSDTHDNLRMISEFVRLLRRYASEYDLLIHLGDFVSPFALRAVQELGVKVVGVFGNNDGDKLLLRQFCPNLQDQPLQLSLCGRSVLLMHGYGSREFTDSVINALAKSGSFNIILYGHTHAACARLINKTLVLNPGALSGYLTERPTYAILNLDDGEASIADVRTGDVLRKVAIP